jgi:predicted dienelactone hydrolase
MSFRIGCRRIAALDPVQGAEVESWLLYPTHDPAHPVAFGPYALELAPDGAPALDIMPVVAVSHGNGGTPWSHRGLAAHLVREGFAVAMIVHPGNNRKDNSLGSPSGRLKAVLLAHRPRHVRLAIDAALADPLVGSRLAAGGYSIVGESIGAYTALAVAGGHAMTVPDDVPDAQLNGPDEELAKIAIPVETESDPRVRAAVLLVPAIGFFLADGALRDVQIPLLVRTAGRDALCSTAKVARALRSLPEPRRLSSAEIPGAGHFSFQTPYPAALAAIPPAQDPPGFDRAAYQPVLHADVTAFLRARA